MYAKLIEAQIVPNLSLGGWCKSGRKPVNARCIYGYWPAQS